MHANHFHGTLRIIDIAMHSHRQVASVNNVATLVACRIYLLKYQYNHWLVHVTGS